MSYRNFVTRNGLKVATTGSIMGASMGLYAGSILGANSPGANVEEGAKVGALAGAAFGAVTPILGTMALRNPVRTLTVGANIASTAGYGLGAGALAIGSVAMGPAGLALGAGSAALATASPFIAKGALEQASGIYRGIDRLLLKDSDKNFFGRKLTKLGVGAVVGSEVFAGAKQAFNQFNQHRMGVRDNYITTATPRVPSYSNNAGATGDLVFAMHNNRRG